MWGRLSACGPAFQRVQPAGRPAAGKIARSGRMQVAMVEIQPIHVEVEREEDGRILASVPALPGVMAYGANNDEAVRKVKSIALQLLADMIASGEDVPEPIKVLFAA
jgi:predicted RNase H-like HicB family nuclease